MLSRRTRSGMTLVDTLIAVAILMTISVFTVTAMSNAVALNAAMKRSDGFLRAPMVKLRRDFQMAYLTESITSAETYRTVFVAEDSDPDQVWFATRAHKRRYRDARESDQAEITIWGERMPRTEGLEDEGLVIYLREAARVDEEPGEGGTVMPIAYNVKEFNLRYLDGRINEWSDTWDTRSADHLNTLPRAVEISMIVLIPPGRVGDDWTEKPQKTTVLLQFADAAVQQAGGNDFGQ